MQLSNEKTNFIGTKHRTEWNDVDNSAVNDARQSERHPYPTHCVEWRRHTSRKDRLRIQSPKPLQHGKVTLLQPKDEFSTAEQQRLPAILSVNAPYQLGGSSASWTQNRCVSGHWSMCQRHQWKTRGSTDVQTETTSAPRESTHSGWLAAGNRRTGESENTSWQRGPASEVPGGRSNRSTCH